MQQNGHDDALVPFTAYQARAIQELDAEYSMWVEIVDRHTDEMQRSRDDFEKLRNGFMTLLTKLERQEGIISQLQLELQSYRIAAQKLNLVAQSGQVDSGQMSSGQFHAPATKASAKGGHSVRNVHPKTSSRRIKGEVIRQYAQTYPQKTHSEIATHFQVSTKTVQRSLKSSV
jgi:hypothetical protein